MSSPVQVRQAKCPLSASVDKCYNNNIRDGSYNNNKFGMYVVRQNMKRTVKETKYIRLKSLVQSTIPFFKYYIA